MEKNLKYLLNIQNFAEGDDIDYGDPEDVTEDDVENETDDVDEQESDDRVDDDTDSEEDSDEDYDDNTSKDKEEDGDGTDTTESKKPQNSKVNKEFAKIRREQEAKEKQEKEARENYVKGFIAAVGGKNPFTGEDIVDDDDIEECEIMLEAKKRGLDPISDFHKMSKILTKEKKEKISKQEKEKVEHEANVRAEIEQFQKENPNVDLKELLDNPDFKNLVDPIISKIGLNEAYKLYTKVIENENKVKEDLADKRLARRESSTGPLNGGNHSQDDEFYTLEQLKKMSPAEIDENLEKVEKSYERILRK